MKVVVTGGGGFLGKALCKALVDRGDEVHALQRGDYPELGGLGVRAHRVDLSDDPETFRRHFDGAGLVFHVAAKVDMWGPRAAFERVNVTGTRNVLDCCRRAGVRRLVYTSSPSVVAHHGDLRGVDETQPYPRHFQAEYPRTKAQAEREVLEANGGMGVTTIALRPHLIFGPGDTNLIPTVLERARAGRLVRIGNGKNLSDFTYIDDCVTAHLLAADALERNPAARGKAYFISQGDPVPLWWFVDEVLERSGLPKIKKRVPLFVAKITAALAEWVARNQGEGSEPFLTKFLVHEMASDHYFNISRAKTDLGFSPSVTVAEGLDRTFPR